MAERVGKNEGDPCNRQVGTWGNTRTCTGTITHIGTGQDEQGRGWTWRACDTCSGGQTREQLPDVETLPLFEVDT